jgi:hypothetical protein
VTSCPSQSLRFLRFSRASELGQYPTILSRALYGWPVVPRIFYASNNVRNFCFLFKEEPPVIGPQRLGGPLSGTGVLRMEALKLGAVSADELSEVGP